MLLNHALTMALYTLSPDEAQANTDRLNALYQQRLAARVAAGSISQSDADAAAAKAQDQTQIENPDSLAAYAGDAASSVASTIEDGAYQAGAAVAQSTGLSTAFQASNAAESSLPAVNEWIGSMANLGQNISSTWTLINVAGLCIVVWLLYRLFIKK